MPLFGWPNYQGYQKYTLSKFYQKILQTNASMFEFCIVEIWNIFINFDLRKKSKTGHFNLQ
jgi:hypothetical protein